MHDAKIDQEYRDRISKLKRAHQCDAAGALELLKKANLLETRYLDIVFKCDQKQYAAQTLISMKLYNRICSQEIFSDEFIKNILGRITPQNIKNFILTIGAQIIAKGNPQHARYLLENLNNEDIEKILKYCQDDCDNFLACLSILYKFTWFSPEHLKSLVTIENLTEFFSEIEDCDNLNSLNKEKFEGALNQHLKSVSTSPAALK